MCEPLPHLYASAPASRKGELYGCPAPNLVDILVDLLDQPLHAVECHLSAKVGGEFEGQSLAVLLRPRVVEQMRFDHQWGFASGELRIRADRHAGEPLPALIVANNSCVDPLARHLQRIIDIQIDGWESHLSAALLAPQDCAVDNIVSAKQL